MTGLTQILVPVALFTAIVIALALLVLGARAWLVPSEPVTIQVNGRRTIEADPGSKLLWTLAEHGIYLPAACGGRGTCGQCRVVVERGGGPLLPTEMSHINRREAARGDHLACMVSVRDDLDIRVADDLLEAKRWHCAVRSSRFLAPFLKEIVLAMPAGERMDFEAGDYVLLEAPAHSIVLSDLDVDPEYLPDWERFGVRELESVTTEAVVRAYSLANAPGESDVAVLVVRLATPPPRAPAGTPPGRASAFIFGLEPGDGVTLSGPFGEFHAHESGKEMVMIAGGAGIAPIRSIIRDQLARGASRKISFWFGVRQLSDLCYRAEFDALATAHDNFEWHAALSAPGPADEWHGPTGFIHTVVYEQYLKNHPAPETAEYYLCGPPLMSGAVIQMLEELGVERDSIFFDDFGS